MADDIRQVILKLEKSNLVGQCLFVDHSGNRCSGKSINSHSLQKSIVLKSIVEAGHVLSLGLNGRFGADPPSLEFKRLGQSKASVFPGFCAKHDSEIFKEAEEGSPISTKRQAALLGYRVTCLKYFKKERNIATFSNVNLRNAAKANGYLGEIDGFLEGTILGFKDLQRCKTEHEAALHANSFDKFHAVVMELTSTLPFCFATPFAPEFTFDGLPILPGFKSKWNSVSAFAGKFGSKDIFLICGFESDYHDVKGFIASMSKIPSNFCGSAALHLALQYAENTYFRESWINSLDESVRLEMLTAFLNGTPGISNSQKERLLLLPDIINIPQSAAMYM